MNQKSKTVENNKFTFAPLHLGDFALKDFFSITHIKLFSQTKHYDIVRRRRCPESGFGRADIFFRP